MLDILLTEPSAIYVIDRGYPDFKRLFGLTEFGSFFVILPKSKTRFRRQYPQPADRIQGVLCDQTVVLTVKILTDNFAIPALSIAELYRHRWEVELFFKWINQHLKIKSFYGTSDNAVKSQISIEGISVQTSQEGNAFGFQIMDKIPD